MRAKSLVIVGWTLIIAGGAAAAVAFSGRAPVREITLVARDMSFYIDGQSTPNPRLEVRIGERVRITVRNEAPGLVHAFAIDAVRAATPNLTTGSSTTVEFRAPDQRGEYEYYCPPHALMMRGTLAVTGPPETH
jgi:plastocyanin